MPSIADTTAGSVATVLLLIILSAGVLFQKLSRWSCSGPNEWTMKAIKDYLRDKMFPYIKFLWNDPVPKFDIPEFHSNIKSDEKKD